MATKTFPVAAGAKRVKKEAANLTHACEVDAAGSPIRVLCDRVKIESILDDLTQATDEAPTCPVCASRAKVSA